jgi:phosphonate transport system ATP-binding protein
MVIFDGSPQKITSEEIYQVYGSEAGDLIIDVGGRHVG